MSKFLIYKSSAGSGKTTALVRVFLALCLSANEDKAFRRILAITFTNKAANEMKERVLSELHHLSRLTPPFPERAYTARELVQTLGITEGELVRRAGAAFTAALHNYGELELSTIDRFNLRLVRAFSRDLGLPADFDVELEEQSLFRESAERLLALAGLDEEITGHLVAYVEQLQDEEKRTEVLRGLEALHPLVMSEAAINALQALHQVDSGHLRALPLTLLTRMQAWKGEVQELAQSILQLLAKNDIDAELCNRGNNGYYSFVQKAAAPWQEPPQPNSYVEKAINESNFWSAKAKPQLSRLQGLEPELASRLGKLYRKVSQEAVQYHTWQLVYRNLHLMALLGHLEQTMVELCTMRNVQPISSFNRIISESLRHEPAAFIYELVGHRYHHLLIDEFQDTSELQWLNLVPLVEESLSTGHTAMVVGDAKQSIYRWRGGKAEQFIALPGFTGREADRVPPEVRSRLRQAAEETSLTTNYRSLPVVVEFNNRLFRALKNELLKDAQPLSPFRQEYESPSAWQQSDPRKQGGYVETFIIEGADKDDITHLELCVQTIRDALVRGYRPAEIAILVRSTGKEGSTIASHLAKAGITVASNDSYSLDENPWVACLLALLQLSIQPQLTSAQVNAMRTLCVLHDLPYEPWKYYRSKGRELSISAFLSANGLPRLPRTALLNAYQLCEQYCMTYMPQKRNDLHVNAFLNCILKRGKGVGVRAFMEWWNSLRTKPGVPGSSDGNSVQMMTIHKSKGLQFPVVIMPYLNWQLEKTGTRWLELDPATAGLPVVPVKYTENGLKAIGRDDLLSAHREEVRFDNLNLVYVAATRAEHQLTLIVKPGKTNYVGAHLAAALKALPDETWENGVPQHADVAPEAASDFHMTHYHIGVKPVRKEPGAGPTHPDSHMADYLTLPDAPKPEMLWQERFSLAIPPAMQHHNRATREGNLLHEAMSLHPHSDAVHRWLRRAEANGTATFDEVERVQAMFDALTTDTLFRDITTGAELLSERELTAEGRVLRPDMVAVKAAEVVVIDFKTGSRRAEHSAQVAGYVQALRAMYPHHEVKGYVCYTDPVEWIRATGGSAVQGVLF
jgi:ATP-dependent exoDNAse (exonuclease V) beta subunit